MQKQIAVIGLGKFGSNLCIQLAQQGAQVLAVDADEAPIHKISETVSEAIIADVTDEDVVKELNLSNFDCVVVSTGSDIRASILVTLILKEAGIENLWVKAKDMLHVRVLKKIGADHIINPEREMAIQLTEKLLISNLVGFVHLSDDTSIYEINVPDKFIGAPLSNLNLDKEIQLLALKRSTELIKDPLLEDILLTDDILVLGGKKQKLQLFMSRF